MELRWTSPAFLPPHGEQPAFGSAVPAMDVGRTPGGDTGQNLPSCSVPQFASTTVNPDIHSSDLLTERGHASQRSPACALPKESSAIPLVEIETPVRPNDAPHPARPVAPPAERPSGTPRPKPNAIPGASATPPSRRPAGSPPPAPAPT